MLDEQIKQLEQELELKRPLRSEKEGVYLLAVDEGIEITISSLGEGFAFFATLAKLPDGAQETLIEEMMLANLMGQGTEGAILGLNEEEKMITLSMEYPYPFDYTLFQEQLEQFLNGLDYWMDELKQEI